MLLTTLLRGHGRAQQTCRRIMAHAAIDIAHSAARGEIDETDADRLYTIYYQAAKGVKITTDNKCEAGFRVNTSKMRQIIKAANPELLVRVMKASDRVPMGRRKPLYAAMVDACRSQLAGRKITAALMLKLVSR